jgi:hypothetical protein
MRTLVIARSESDEAIQLASRKKAGLLRFARNDEFWLFEN